MSLSASVTLTANDTVITYPTALLTIAQSLIDQGLFDIAIITSHMACEVAAERAFDAAYAAKNLETLGEAIDGLMVSLRQNGEGTTKTCAGSILPKGHGRETPRTPGRDQRSPTADS